MRYCLLLLYWWALPAAAWPGPTSVVYSDSLPAERISLQLSEAVVATGQTLWFQGTLFGEEADSRVVYVELLSDREAVLRGIYPVRKGVARGQWVLPDTLSGGWYQLRAYTQWMRNFGASAFATHPLLVVNPTESSPERARSGTSNPDGPVAGAAPEALAVQINLSQTDYPARASVTADVRLSGPDSARVAVSVRKVNPLSSQQRTRSNAASPSKEGRLDVHYPREDESLTVRGSVVGMDPKTKDRMVLLSIPGQSPYLEYDFVDQDGSFRIPIKEDVRGLRTMVLQPSDTSLRLRWTLADQFAPENTYAAEAFPPVADSVAAALLRSYAQRTQVRAQYDLFLPADSAAAAPPAEFRFYGAPNFTIRPDDYTALPTFTEVNRELMPGVRLRQGRRGYDLDVFDIPSRTFLDGEPSVFLDGVLVHNLPYIVALPPDSMALIETVNRRTYYGQYRMDGVVAIYTPAGDAYRDALAPSALVAPTALYSPYRAFARADSLSAYEPDLRTLLHWQPAVSLNRDPYRLTWDNADELGEFEVVVAGVTADGRRVYGRKTYTVSWNGSSVGE